MRVGINCVFLVPGEMGGMETYARALIPRLAAEGVEAVCFVPQEAAGDDLGGAEQVVVGVDARDRVQWVRGEQLVLPGLARRAGCELVHSLASTGPVRGRFKRVVTVHDLHYKTVPQAHFGLRARGMAALVPAAARRSDRVLCDSEATRADVLTHLRLPARKLEVVPLGVEVPATSPDPVLRDELRARFGLAGRRVVLTTGGTRPHKNVARLVEAVAGLDDAVLVVTGYATPEDARLDGLAHVVRTGLVSRTELDALYGLADVVCAPSLAEGFGLPVLEAMGRGVPVACSATGALGEVAGDAAITFDPLEVSAIRQAVGWVLSADPSERERLVSAGRQRAAHFTWQRCAAATVAAYRAVL